jgi:hypothetical protein
MWLFAGPLLPSRRIKISITIKTLLRIIEVLCCPFGMKKRIRAADAKEVGVGNPAEETCCYPNTVSL